MHVGTRENTCDRRLPRRVQVFRDGWRLEGEGRRGRGNTRTPCDGVPPRVEPGCRGAVGREAGRDGARSERRRKEREGQGGWPTTRDQYTKIRRQPARTYVRVRVRASARVHTYILRTPSIYALTYANCKYNLSGPPCIRATAWMRTYGW